MNKDFLYTEIARGIANQISTGVLKAGDKLPSVRVLCREYGISMNTAKRVFLELESLSLVNSKPQTGYYVSLRPHAKLPLPAVSRPSAVASTQGPDELLDKVYANMGSKDFTLFSIAVPSADLLPLEKLSREVSAATRGLHGNGVAYESVQGNVKLRRMVAIRSLGWGGSLHEDDLITTNGAMNALSFCLMAAGKPGDTIAMESPCFPGTLQLATGLGFKVLEMPTHPVTGLEIDALKQVLPKIDLCLLVPNFNTPLGSCMPEENKEEVVALLAKHNIPLIEDDIYGDLFFGSQRPKCCKAFDTEGNVLWCSSVSKTLAPGYRVGWIAPGKYKDKILKLKLVHSISSPAIAQEAVGNFLNNGKYETHLRQLRRTLRDNYQKYVRTIAEHFPEGTKTSRPQGGLSLWVEFDKRIDTAKLYDYAIKHQISIAPGRMFTLQSQFENCVRLCFGMQWNAQIESSLKHLGTLAKAMLPGRD
ncbi:aminotransferase-like domain-containing protein [Dyadobacter aurulentus]|uniref:aminotransferase-like domain-containing protein n=1 Tax=Dyadobacter sp. UC 10 TaxID=2605428 RepID=UPI0011F3F1D9|nr:PLP-dependent aminotransferase family protein [Dyadobacter sp. UC 10]KAA0992744.1 PLP-dependent aminotransferase family protein [Dyadobacter sp. UC 10]